MKKQILKALALTVLMLLSVAPAHAQSTNQVAVTVPFDFSVNGKAMPAGDYTIEAVQIAGSQAVRLIDRKGQVVATVATRAVQGRFQRESRLVFHRYGDQSFLAEIWTLGEKTGHRLSPSRAETEVARNIGAGRRQAVSIPAPKR